MLPLTILLYCFLFIMPFPLHLSPFSISTSSMKAIHLSINSSSGLCISELDWTTEVGATFESNCTYIIMFGVILNHARLCESTHLGRPGQSVPSCWGHRCSISWVRAAPKENAACTTRGVDGNERYGTTGSGNDPPSRHSSPTHPNSCVRMKVMLLFQW